MASKKNVKKKASAKREKANVGRKAPKPSTPVNGHNGKTRPRIAKKSAGKTRRSPDNVQFQSPSEESPPPPKTKKKEKA